jgi:hypothetical protein
METSAVIALVTAVTQLGVAAAALRLANALKARHDDHEIRIVVLERVAGVVGSE